MLYPVEVCDTCTEEPFVVEEILSAVVSSGVFIVTLSGALIVEKNKRNSIWRDGKMQGCKIAMNSPRIGDGVVSRYLKNPKPGG
jgi:hypothetical protein